jgi:hypothetical protein
VESRTGYARRLSGSFIAKTIKSLPFQPGITTFKIRNFN